MSDRKHYRTACTQKHIQKAGMGTVREQLEISHEIYGGH